MSRILIIDDDRALCRSLELHLEGEGHEVETAFCAAEGLDMVKETRPEIVFCDLSLPGDGLSLLTAIRTHVPRSVVIMITGVQDTKATIEAVRRGAFDYIRKPLDLQAKLLRALQEREFERVGGSETLKLEARVVAATNRDLDSLVKEEAFREDLAYRLAVSRIRVPPLRERKSDIPLLVRHILPRISREVHKPVETVSESALRLLGTYDWPGNVRELENVLTRAVLLSHETVLSREAVEAAMGSPAAQSREEPPSTAKVRRGKGVCRSRLGLNGLEHHAGRENPPDLPHHPQKKDPRPRPRTRVEERQLRGRARENVAAEDRLPDPAHVFRPPLR